MLFDFIEVDVFGSFFNIVFGFIRVIFLFFGFVFINIIFLEDRFNGICSIR